MTYSGVTAGGSAAMTAISQMTLASPAASIDITSIPTTYRTLMGVLAAATTSGISNQMDALRMTFNNVSTSGAYTYMGSRVPSTGATYPTLIASAAGATFMKIGDLSPYPPQYTTHVRFFVSHYANTTQYAQVSSESNYNDGNTSSNFWRFSYAAQFGFTSAVTRLTLTTVGNFATGTDFALYGLS